MLGVVVEAVAVEQWQCRVPEHSMRSHLER